MPSIKLPEPIIPEGAVRRRNEQIPNEDVTALLHILDTERADARAEREQWSRAAEVLGLAPYGGAYDPNAVLPAVRALAMSNREMRRRLAAHLPRFRPFTPMPPLPATPTPTDTEHTVRVFQDGRRERVGTPEPLIEEAGNAIDAINKAAMDDVTGQSALDDTADHAVDAAAYSRAIVMWPDLAELMLIWAFGPYPVGPGLCAPGAPADTRGDSTVAALAHVIESASSTGTIAEEYAQVTGYDVAPARLDADGTAQGKTEIRGVATVDEWGYPSPSTTPVAHVDTETGKSLPFDGLRAQAATGKLGYGAHPRRDAIYCVHGPHITPGLFCKCPPECPCRSAGQCPP